MWGGTTPGSCTDMRSVENMGAITSNRIWKIRLLLYLAGHVVRLNRAQELKHEAAVSERKSCVDFNAGSSSHFEPLFSMFVFTQPCRLLVQDFAERKHKQQDHIVPSAASMVPGARLSAWCVKAHAATLMNSPGSCQQMLALFSLAFHDA